LDRKKKGLFVGLCTKDILYYTDELPAHNHKSKTEDFAVYIGGPAANAAITYAALGGDATLATCLGDSMESRAMIEELKGYGVKVLNYSEYDTLPNTACIVVSGDGKRTILSGQHRFEVNRTYDLSAYDFVLFDCNQQEISLDILTGLDETVGKGAARKPVVLDAGSFKPNIEKFLKRADIVIASEDFADAAGRTILEMDCGATHKAMTRGERPILYLGTEIEGRGPSVLPEKTEIPVEQVTAVDTLGAGDIFHGAFCYGYFERGYSCEEALRFAGKVASESVKYRGPREWMKYR
jgi:sugar/nucleoside kinase (ribokinase family)